MVKIVIRIESRFGKTLEVFNQSGLLVDKASSQEDLFSFLAEMLKKNGISWSNISKVEIAGSERFLTSLRSAYALGNAIKYALGLIGAENFQFPSDPSGFFPYRQPLR